MSEIVHIQLHFIFILNLKNYLSKRSGIEIKYRSNTIRLKTEIYQKYWQVIALLNQCYIIN